MPLQPHHLTREQIWHRATRKGTQECSPGVNHWAGTGGGKEAGAFNLYSGLYISPCVLAWEERNEPFINF